MKIILAYKFKIAATSLQKTDQHKYQDKNYFSLKAFSFAKPLL